MHASMLYVLSALPELCDSDSSPPPGSIDLGNGYMLLRKCDKYPVLPSHGTMGAIADFLDHPVPIPKIKRWARLLLPNGQVARSAWRECLKPPDKLRVSRMIKVISLYTVFYFNSNTF